MRFRGLLVFEGSFMSSGSRLKYRKRAFEMVTCLEDGSYGECGIHVVG